MADIDIASYIDHTLLKLDATEAQIDQLCEEAKTYKFKSVCVRLPWVKRCVDSLAGTGVLVACVVGFHEGTYATAEKVNEALAAISAGASELDMVLHYPSLLSGNTTSAYEDVLAVREAAPSPTVLKVIVETSQLDKETLLQACEIVVKAGADFIKTSTGFNGRGASLEDVRTMRDKVGRGVRVKASGGIRTLDDVRRMVDAGAGRIGASAGVGIMREVKGGEKEEGDGY